MPPDPANFQAEFHRRWLHLNNPHVRSLAWLLDAPDLLDPNAPQWQGKIASLGPIEPQTEDWLNALDKSPGMLHTYLGIQPFTRLGRYAEKLMAFYFAHQGMLVAHGLQVQAGKNETIGEFDFLLRQGGALVHWEFASKFYLLESCGAALAADHFVGPNLADSLGAKVRKIMDRQLTLSQHPAAQLHLPQPVTQAQALVKGWLFYYGQTPQPAVMTGLSKPHCRGFWCPLAELDAIAGQRYMILPRLSWLAPAKAGAGQCLHRHQVQESLSEHFSSDSMPVLIAILDQVGDDLIEIDRGFIVPDDWKGRAGEKVSRMVLAA
ncbi:DUF1853 family protein [Noviherbaspirillum cavernae]|uniref:DUF1853 family protein n=1 Tax=Noviherbaspirillum cavernae TaxID=2320862 RepID=A0A418X0L7_9BURK|nr:DUF1853 family protein [Noviherbaspirillum cavernae]RJG06019.1 DUF1853 family protein [Noviherbaspirillum cavernae]